MSFAAGPSTANGDESFLDYLNKEEEIKFDYVQATSTLKFSSTLNEYVLMKINREVVGGIKQLQTSSAIAERAYEGVIEFELQNEQNFKNKYIWVGV